MSDVYDTDRMYLQEQLVHQYLLENPSFFQRHPDLLTKIRLPHAQRGTVSLVDRQLEQHRERVRALEEDITHLLSMARQNEHLFYAFNQLHLDLAMAHTFSQIRDALSAFGQTMPRVHACTFYKLSNDSMGEHFIGLQLMLEHRLQGRQVYLGSLNKDEMATLFPSSIQSVALLLISAADKPQALLAFGSEHSDHYQPSMDTFFLDQIAKLLAVTLLRDEFTTA